MGGSLSAKYENINHDFDIGVWKVHDAISKSSGKHVSLWIIDYQLMKQRDRNKKVRRRYLQHCQNAIQIQQKISHRNILKILEYDSAGKKFGFASEKINCCLSNETKYSRDEAMYITQQLAITLDYLHENHKLVFQGLCPDNVFLSPSFTLKLGLFLHATPFQSETAPIQHPFMPWQPNSIYFVPANYCAPEIVNGSLPITVNVDVYMFALLVIYVFTGRPPSEATSSSDLDVSLPLAACKELPEEYSLLLKSCLNLTPASRPSFQSIINDEAFSSLVCSIFKYLEIILTKDPKDLFNFFAGLKSYINVFSFRIIRQKFMPIFIYFIRKDVRYGIALLPMILKIHNKFNDRQFLEDVVTPLRPIFSVTEPTTIPGILIDHLAIFMNRIPPQKYEEFVYPIILNALKVSSKSVIEKVLKVLPYVVSVMSTEVLKAELIPIMKKVIENLQNPDTAQSFVEIVILTMKKTGPVFIAEEAIPSIRSLWFRTNFVQIAEKVTDLLVLMTVPIEILASTLIPTATSILTNPKVPLITQARLIDFIRKSLSRIQNERQITSEELDAAAAYKVKEYNFPTDQLKEFNDSDDDNDNYDEAEEEEYKENENYSYDEDESNNATDSGRADNYDSQNNDDLSDSSKSKSRSKSFDPKKQQQLIQEENTSNLRERRKTLNALGNNIPANSNNSPSTNSNNNNCQFPSSNFNTNFSENNNNRTQQLPVYQNNNSNSQFDMRRFSLTESRQSQLNIPPIVFPKDSNCSSGNEPEEVQLPSTPIQSINIHNCRPRNKTFSQTQPIRPNQPFLPTIDMCSVQKQSNPPSFMNQSRSQSQFDIFPKADEQNQPNNQQNQPKVASKQRGNINFSDTSPGNSPRATNSSGHNPFVQLNFSQITSASSNQQHAATARCSAQNNPFNRSDSKSNQSNESSSSTAISLSPNDQVSPRRSVMFDHQANINDPFSQQHPPPSPSQNKNTNHQHQHQQQQKPNQPPGGVRLDMEDPFAAALAERQNNSSSTQFQIFTQQQSQGNPFNSSGLKSNPFNSSGNNQRRLNSPFGSTNNVRNNDGFEFEFDQ